jgi:hypothetical protein
MAAALVVGLGAAVAGEPDSDARPEPRGLLSGLFGDKPKPKAKTEKKPATDDRPACSRTTEAVIFEQQRQMNALLRRMQVCDRLRLIAEQTGNDELMRQADELEARAEEIYRQQTAQLPLPSQPLESDATPPTPKPGVKPVDAPERPGGGIEQSEREVHGDTNMGRDRP